MHPVSFLPPGMRRFDHEHLVQLNRSPRLIFGEQNFVQFFAGADSDVLHQTSRSDRFRQIDESHTGNLRHEDFATVHLFDRGNHKTYTVLQSKPEARHPWIGNGDAAALALFEKNRYHTAAAANYVSVAGATESSLLRARVGIRLHEHFLGTQFGGAVQIDRIDSLIRAECKNPLYFLIDRRINDIAAAHDICLNGLERVVLAGGNLLQRRCVHDHRDSGKSALQSSRIAYVSDEIAQSGIIESRGAHIVLLEFVPAKDHQPFRTILPQHDFHEFFPERTRAARYQNDLIRPIHMSRLGHLLFTKVVRRSATPGASHFKRPAPKRTAQPCPASAKARRS